MTEPASQYQALFQLRSDQRPVEVAPLRSPQLDDRSEKKMVEEAIARVLEVSEEALNDFTPGSPTRALLEGQALVAAKIAYVANLVGHKAAVDFLQIAGVQQLKGKASTVVLYFRLVGALANPITVPKGYRVRANGSSNNIVFETTKALIIKAGTVSGEVKSVCTATGTEGNVSANSITRPLQNIAFVKSVTNPLPAAGGENEESEKGTISRGFLSLRRRGLVSRWDYEQFVREFTTSSLVVRAYGRIDAQGRFTTTPQVLIAACHPSGSPLERAEKESLLSALNQAGFIGLYHQLTDISVTKLDLQLTTTFDDEANTDAVGQAIYEALSKYLAIGENWIEAELISNELEVQARLVPGVAQIHLLFFAKTGLQSALDSYRTGRFEVVSLENLTITALQGGQTFVLSYGPGDPD